MPKLIKFLNYYLPPIIVSVLIFLLSSIAGQDYPEMTIAGQDYSFITNSIAHIIEFGLLAFLTLRAFDQGKLSRQSKVLLSLILLLVFAGSDEYHQSFVPGREVRLSDWLMDLLGVLTGLGLYIRVKAWQIIEKK